MIVCWLLLIVALCLQVCTCFLLCWCDSLLDQNQRGGERQCCYRQHSPGHSVQVRTLASFSTLSQGFPINNKNPISNFFYDELNILKIYNLWICVCHFHFVMFIIMWPQHRHEKNISLVSPSIIIPVLFIWTNKSIKAAGASGGVLLLAKPQVLDALIFNTAWYETAAVAGVSHPPWHNILQLHTTQPYHADCGICLHPQRWPFALTLKMNRMIFRNVLWSDINI